MITGTVALIIFSLALCSAGASLGYFYGGIVMERRYVAALQKEQQYIQQQQQQAYAQQYQGALQYASPHAMLQEQAANPIGFRMN